MLVSDYILSRLAEEGIDTCFTVYGGAMAELLDAFPRQDKIKYVVTQHEQAAAFACEGYAQVKGVPGLCLVTSGPGGHNIVTGVANCFYNSVPAIFITGQVNSKFIRPNEDIRQLGFQESPIVDIVRPITKFASQCLNVDDLKLDLELAINACKTGRIGPVLLDIPVDVQKSYV